MTILPYTPKMSAIEQNALELLARFPIDNVKDGPHKSDWERILADIETGSDADEIAHALVGEVNRTVPSTQAYEYAIALLRNYGNHAAAMKVSSSMQSHSSLQK